MIPSTCHSRALMILNWQLTTKIVLTWPWSSRRGLGLLSNA